MNRKCRCLECSHIFPEDTLTLDETGFGCPKCKSTNVERTIPERGYEYDKVNVQYKEGPHD